LGRVGAAQLRESGARSKLSFGAILALAIGLAAIVLGGSASAAEQVQVTTFGSAGTGAGQMGKPGGIGVDQSTGDFYVADIENERIDKFGPQGEFLLAWGWGVNDGSAELQTCTTTCQAGLAGQGLGQMETPKSLAVGPDGDVYVLNQSFFDGRIQRFTGAGALVETFGGVGPGEEEFSFPLPEADDIAVDSTGRVFVNDTGRAVPRVAIFDSTGTLEGAIEGTPNHRLESLGSLAIGANDELFVAGTNENGISVYAPSGEFERFIGRGTTALSLAVNPENGNVLASQAKGFFNPAHTLAEYEASGKLLGSGPLPVSNGTSFESPIGLAFDANPAADVPGTNPGLVLATDLNANQVLGLAEPSAAKPSIAGVTFSAVSSDAGNVTGTVNPNGLSTTYLVEYGTTPSYGSKTAPTPLPASHKEEHATVHLVGLAVGTTYHFRLVAENAEGPEVSADGSFTTLAAGSPFALPDGRVYEMVTPILKGNNDAEAHGMSTANGESVTFSSLNGLPGAEGGGLLGASVSSRGGSGWATVPASSPTENENTLATSAPVGFSNDLREEVVFSPLQLTGNAPAGWNMYLRTNPSALGQPAGEQLMTPEGVGFTCATPPSPTIIGSSANFQHIVFTAAAKLTADSPDLTPPKANAFECGPPQLYEWDAGTLRNIGILPGETTPTLNGVTAIAGNDAVSNDGSKVFFSARPQPARVGEIVQTQLYMRSGGTTVKISEAETPPSEPNLSEVHYEGASVDGSVVYFTTEARLTANASPVGTDLYRYQTANGQLTDLTPNFPAGANVRQVLVSADGNVLYFGANGELVPGSVAGGGNLYRLQVGGQPTYLGELEPSDQFLSLSPFQPVGFSSRTTANGGVFVLTTKTNLTGGPELIGPFGAPAEEIYRFTAGQVGFECVSCANGGGPVNGAVVAGPAYPGSIGGHALSADGSRVFFETADALVPQDNNGKADVYEWEGGQVHLISTGLSGQDSHYLDADETGNNVFFTTRQSLVSADGDEKYDVYDARVGGGFAEAPTSGPPCEAEACRPPLEAAPPAAQLGSKSFQGPPNKKPKHKKHHKKTKGKHHKKKLHGRRNTTGKRG
jgi:hypothetical protein